MGPCALRPHELEAPVKDQAPTEMTPRSFDLDPSGAFLFAAGEGSGNIVSYRIDPKGRGLNRLETYEVGKAPWWVMAVEVPSK
jgi:6-phosphogluconolactonase